MVLRIKEFMRRFLQHVLPKKFVRIRHFGLFGNRYRKQKIEIIRKLKGIVEKVREKLELSWKDLLEKTTGFDARKCPSCKVGELFEVAELGPLLNTS